MTRFRVRGTRSPAGAASELAGGMEEESRSTPPGSRKGS